MSPKEDIVAAIKASPKTVRVATKQVVTTVDKLKQMGMQTSIGQRYGVKQRKAVVIV